MAIKFSVAAFPTHIIKDRLYGERGFLFSGFISWEKGQPVSVAIYSDTGFADRFYDPRLSFFRIWFWGETKFSFQAGHIFEKTFREKFLRIDEYRYRSIVPATYIPRHIVPYCRTHRFITRTDILTVSIYSTVFWGTDRNR